MSERRRRWYVVIGTVVLVAAIFGSAGLAFFLTRDDSAADVAPVRVLLIGDSIMNQAGAFVEEELEGHEDIGDVVVTNKGRNGTGLLTPDVFDWQAGAARYISDVDPDIVVVLFVGNYTSENLWVNEGGAEIEGYTDEWFDEWEREARDLQATLVSAGADIYWVNPPPMMAEEGERRVTYFRQIHRGIAEDWTDTVLIDGTSVLSDESGNYAFELPDENGIFEQMRSIDSVHLTTAGAEVLAREIARQVVPSVLVAQRVNKTGVG
jgi:hypothetical protein